MSKRPRASKGHAGPKGQAKDDHAIRYLGAQVRDLRRERRMTVNDLAEAAGMSPGLVSQLQRGIGNPSVTTIHQLANALGVVPGRLLDPSASALVSRRGDRQPIVMAQPSEVPTAMEFLTPTRRGVLEAAIVSLEAGASTERSPIQRDGEELVFVLSGSIRVHLGDATFDLSKEDAGVFRGGAERWLSNPRKRPARALRVSVPQPGS